MWLRLRSLFVGRVAVFDQGCYADDVEGEGFGTGCGHGDAQGAALPVCGFAGGCGGVRDWPFSDGLLHDGAARSELGDDEKEAAFGRGAGAAVGGVVAEPDGVGDHGVEVWQVQSGDVAGGAVDEEPGSGLPAPALGGFAGQGVVEAQGSADGEGAVGDVVGVAGGPLFLAAVDDQRADLEGFGGSGGVGRGGGRGRRVGDLAGGAEGDGVDFRTRGGSGGAGASDEQEAGEELQRHGSGAEGLHGMGCGWRGSAGVAERRAPQRAGLAQKMPPALA